MDRLIQTLEELGLSNNEARAYAVLLIDGSMTGYEVAKRSGIARGNVYSCLARLLDKQAVVRTSEDQFIAVALETFVALRQEALRAAGMSAVGEVERLSQTVETAQALSMMGRETILQRCRKMVREATSALFLAAFPDELALLADDLLEAQQRHNPLEVLAFGQSPASLPFALEHAGAEDIRAAQGGRLLMLATWPEGLIAVVDETRSCSGIWAWNRYLASTVGLYVAHELFLLRLWPLLTPEMQQSAQSKLTDYSSKVALAGLSANHELFAHLIGKLAPEQLENKD